MTEPSSNLVEIPEEVYLQVEKGLGQYFTKLCLATPPTIARDMLNPLKTARAYEIMCRYVDPKGKRILEIGSGYGITLISWVKNFGLDVIGVEPEGEGFAETVKVSRELCTLNGVEPERVIVSEGEALPFTDGSFDIVYSSNTIEHCHDPVKLLSEAMRVLKPGGILHLEVPNFTSYFEGHYYIIIPPLLWKGLLPWWVKTVHGRPPDFALTLRTEINPVWLRRTLASIGRQQPLRIISQGEDVFRERLTAPFVFQHKAVQNIIGPIIRTLQRLNFGGILANFFIMMRAHYPIYLTVEKL
jgi:ubiquinone/menaquinone biosynthesis C-methylase UbiE